MASTYSDAKYVQNAEVGGCFTDGRLQGVECQGMVGFSDTLI
jgi:hypothetical protein